MRVTLLSDAHLHAWDDPNQAALVGFLRTWHSEHWVFAGDVFDSWWGWEHTVHSAYVPFLAALAEIRRRGATVTWLGGNHDFAAGGVLARELGIEVAERWEGSVGGKRVLVVHGDEADQSTGYRRTRSLLRGPLPHLLARVLGPDRTWRAARSLSAGSRAQGHGGQAALLEAQREWAQSQPYDVVCVGHSHAPGRIALEAGELVNLGDWSHHHTFAVLDEDVELFRWDGAAAQPVQGPPAWREDWD